MDYLEQLNLKLHSLVIFRGLLGDRVLGLLPALFERDGKDMAGKLNAYTAFTAALFQEGVCLTDCVLNRISEDENFYVLRRARREAVDPAVEQCLASELHILEEVSQLSARTVRSAIGYEGYLPEWKNRPADFQAEYHRMIRDIATLGYGAFSRYAVFCVAQSKITPVGAPDPVRLSDLKGYERERKAVLDNTLALLGGRPAANALLYGDAGTGKSSTIKAMVNEYASRGLRLIEVRKDQLTDIQPVLESLSRNPLKFILFIDDLSFSQNSEAVGMLKAILEGTVLARTPNTVIYATSNRRHIVSEKFSDRGDDEIHRNETIQEQVSLSQRFGLNVCFLKPDREKYLAIVRELARQYGVRDVSELDLLAERYAIDRGGRSPRVARQFVEALKRAEA